MTWLHPAEITPLSIRAAANGECRYSQRGPRRGCAAGRPAHRTITLISMPRFATHLPTMSCPGTTKRLELLAATASASADPTFPGFLSLCPPLCNHSGNFNSIVVLITPVAFYNISYHTYTTFPALNGSSFSQLTSSSPKRPEGASRRYWPFSRRAPRGILSTSFASRRGPLASTARKPHH